ncbi:alpha/beta hydrolase-fold protein [Sphingomonas sp. BK235]|uniref:alpha/beta hydrolase n=1 Tax=Sphingomonas sp. BK235 TaxID=2512131 RepID=UPI001050AD0E|nr:alpha/beta hydrolase-fold protein [Sphingomonas sp. BK235]TCP36026.1 putative esterase [Sphingomonas sp. BK235]
MRLARGAAIALAMIAAPAAAQVATPAPPAVPGARAATVERITVHSPALEHSLEGDSADRAVIVVLPPSYRTSPRRRYPVVYALHGYSIGAEQWTREIHVPQTIEGAFAKGAREMIVVLPDSKTAHNGSMYSASVTTGDYETFVSRDLVAFVDARYRTVADRASRGLAGHSMGGYGTARIGMKHPEVFGALYMMSPCCLSARTPGGDAAADERAVAALRTPGDSATLGWGQRAQLAAAAAWSPNPRKPPLFLDLPTENGRARPEVVARWAANAPLAMLDQYVGNLRRYRAIGLDVGDRDGLKDDARALHDALDRYGIAHRWAVYPGDHVSGVATRVQDEVIPFFAQSLVFP